MKHSPYVSRSLNEVAYLARPADREQGENLFEVPGVDISICPARAEYVSIDLISERLTGLGFELLAGAGTKAAPYGVEVYYTVRHRRS